MSFIDTKDPKKREADEGRYEDANLINLTYNAMMYLFTNIKCNLGGMERKFKSSWICLYNALTGKTFSR